MTTELKSKIKIALENLLQRENEDAFVVFEEINTGKFVQFAGGKYEELLFDLPAQPLEGYELEKAKIILQEYNITFEEVEVFDENGNSAGYQKSFTQTLNNDVDLATELVEKVMGDIYNFNNIELEIIEN